MTDQPHGPARGLINLGDAPASASVFIPMGVLPLSFGMQPSLFGPETPSRSRLLTAAL
jgi:hypothetical protein